MDRDWLQRSDDIRHCLYDISEGDQIAEHDDEVLHSDDDLFDNESDEEFETFRQYK